MRMLRLLLLAVAAMSIALTSPSRAQADDRLTTIPFDPELAEAVAGAGLERVVVRHEGWNESLYTWSRLKLHQLTGRQSLAGQDPHYTILSMMYQPEQWMDAKFLPIEHPRISEVLNLDGKWVSPGQLVHNSRTEVMRTELEALLDQRNERDDLREVLDAVHQIRTIGVDQPGVMDTVITPEMDALQIQLFVRDDEMRREAQTRLRELNRQVRTDRPYLDAGIRLLDRAVVASQLRQEFYLVPDPEAPGGEWITARDAAMINPAWQLETASVELANPRPGSPVRAAAEFDLALTEVFQGGSAARLAPATARFLESARQSRAYPGETYISRKNFYIEHNPTRRSAWLYGLAVVLYGGFFFFRARPWLIAGTVALVIGLALQTLGQLIRLTLTGYVPVSNMYESIVFASWSAMAIGVGLELWKRKGVYGLAAAVIGFVAMIGVGMMPLHDTRIHPLRAVLNSYWLNIHVTAMLVSYGAFMIATVFALGYLFKSYTRRDALFGGTPLVTMAQMEELAYRLVQVGWPILTIGILLGAVWADEAWGRFWGWDPKETWALITWITYTIYLHTRMVLGWRGRISAFACVLGFIMLLITWIGVSYIPWFAGGLHTYASPT